MQTSKELAGGLMSVLAYTGIIGHLGFSVA